jgi:hypothetical protein
MRATRVASNASCYSQGNPQRTNPTLAMPATPKYLRHLKMTLLAHQKLATLSSKIPRPNGNMRSTTLRGPAGKGVRNGANMIRIVETVTTPSLAKWIKLSLSMVQKRDVPSRATQPYALPKEIAADRRSVVQPHLLEGQRADECDAGE